METRSVMKEIPAKRLEIIQDGVERIFVDEGKGYRPQTWLALHVISIMKELEFDYYAAMRTAQILADVLQQRPDKLPIQTFMESVGDKWLKDLPDKIVWFA